MVTHKELQVWRQGIDLAQATYELTRHYPKEELYGLTSQMRRSAVSIPSNIAEGAARRSRNEYLQFLYIASGSASELSTQIEISRRVGMARPDQFLRVEAMTSDISKMLRALISSLKRQH